ncbi:MAG: glutamate racemase [Candidatus Gracilibacteria bacterium]
MIGVFDSGFGGLTILKWLISELPEYDYVYFGDSARAPYGNHSKEKILEFTREGVEFLFSKGANLVILACNTASANALKELQEEMIRKPGIKDKNVLGVVVPIAEAVAKEARDGGRARVGGKMKVAVIGTRATVNSDVYSIEIKKRVDGATVVQKACPLLVPLIEEGYAFKMETKRILKAYLRELKFGNPDVLVPACTHYPILQKDIERIMGRKTLVLNTGKIVAESLKDYLGRHGEMADDASARADVGGDDSVRAHKVGTVGTVEFFTTGDPESFSEMGSVFLGKTFKAERVEVGEK